MAVCSLTIGQDIVDGGDGDDTITGAMIQDNAATTAQSLEAVDEIDGGDGEDTLSVTIDTAAAPIVSNVEHFIVRNVDTALVAVDMANFDDSLESVTVRDSAIAVTLNNVQSAASIALNNVSAAVVIDFDDDVLDSDDATVSVSVDEFTSTLTLNVGGDDVITTLDLTVVDDSTVALAQTGTTDTIETVTISGSGDITITESATSFDAITEVDASGLTGGLTIALTSAAAAVTFTGGSGDDDVTASGDDDVISTGAGDDTITMAAGDLTIDAGAGDDTVEMTGLTADDDIDGGAGTNTASLAADDLADLETFTVAGSIANFSVAALTTLLSADLTFDANGTGIDTVDATINLGTGGTRALTLDNFSGGTLIIGAAQTDDITVLSVGATDSVAVEFDAAATIAVANLVLTDVETVSIEVGEDDAVTLTAADFDGVTSLTLTGAGLIDMDAATADSLETVDLSAFTGDFDIDLEASDGVEVIIGNLTGDSVLTLNAANVTADTITFDGGELDFDVLIEAFEAGIGGDIVDLSAFGITSLTDADLTIAQNGTDVDITIDGVDGVITLDTVTIANLDASNFIFA